MFLFDWTAIEERVYSTNSELLKTIILNGKSRLSNQVK